MRAHEEAEREGGQGRQENWGVNGYWCAAGWDPLEQSFLSVLQHGGREEGVGRCKGKVAGTAESHGRSVWCFH